MPHLIQPAPTGRAKCRGCGGKITQGELRFGEMVPNPFADGDTTHWFHLECAAYKRPEPVLATVEAFTEPLPNAEALKAAAKLGLEHHRLPRLNGAERSASGRAECRSCRTPIAKGAWRIPLVFYEEGQFSPAGFVHVPCAGAYFETKDETQDLLARIQRFAPSLTPDDLRELQSELGSPPA